MSLFGRLSPAAHQEARLEAQRQAKADMEFRALLGSYGELVRDPRYAEVRDQMARVLEDRLSKLVEAAGKGQPCVGLAASIQFLKEIVAYPLSAAYVARAEERLREARTGENGADGV